jgi:hypothetical protein
MVPTRTIHTALLVFLCEEEESCDDDVVDSSKLLTMPIQLGFMFSVSQWKHTSAGQGVSKKFVVVMRNGSLFCHGSVVNNAS